MNTRTRKHLNSPSLYSRYHETMNNTKTSLNSPSSNFWYNRLPAAWESDEQPMNTLSKLIHRVQRWGLFDVTKRVLICT